MCYLPREEAQTSGGGSRIVETKSKWYLPSPSCRGLLSVHGWDPSVAKPSCSLLNRRKLPAERRSHKTSGGDSRRAESLSKKGITVLEKELVNPRGAGCHRKRNIVTGSCWIQEEPVVTEIGTSLLPREDFCMKLLFWKRQLVCCQTSYIRAANRKTYCVREEAVVFWRGNWFVAKRNTAVLPRMGYENLLSERLLWRPTSKVHRGSKTASCWRPGPSTCWEATSKHKVVAGVVINLGASGATTKFESCWRATVRLKNLPHHQLGKSGTRI